MRKIKWKPSPALLVAVLAISIALVGTAAAGPIDNPIAQDSRLTKKDRRIAAKIARKISARLIKRFTPIFANRQITRRAPNLSVANANNADGVNDGAISTDKLADDAVTGGKINESSTPFGRIVHMATGDSTMSISGALTDYPIQNRNYTQDAGELNQFAAAARVRFEAGCTQPRSANAYLFVDSPNPLAFVSEYLAASGQIIDASAGTVTKEIPLATVADGGKSLLFQPSADTERTLHLVLQGTCDGGAGINAVFGGVNVIGTR